MSGKLIISVMHMETVNGKIKGNAKIKEDVWISDCGTSGGAFDFKSVEFMIGYCYELIDPIDVAHRKAKVILDNSKRSMRLAESPLRVKVSKGNTTRIVEVTMVYRP